MEKYGDDGRSMLVLRPGPCCSRWLLVGRRAASTAQESINEKNVLVENEPKKVDISRLKPRHRVLISGGIPPIEFEWEHKRTAQRERFGTGVSPSKCWPTVEEVEEEEALGLFREYQDALAEVNALEAKKAAKERARQAEVEKKEKAYPAVLAKWQASQVKAEKEKDAKELQLEKRIREIQEYFGYWIDPKDPRFEVMLKQKEAEEKKAEKLARRLEKEKKTLAAVS